MRETSPPVGRYTFTHIIALKLQITQLENKYKKVENLRFSVHFFFHLNFYCRSSLSLIVDTTHLSDVLIAGRFFRRFEPAAHSLHAQTLCMLSPKRQSLFRTPIFRCFNQRASVPQCIASKACSLTYKKHEAVGL